MIKWGATSESRIHQGHCVIRNRRLAALALFFSVVMLLAGFKELYRPFLMTREPVFVNAGTLCLVGLMVLSMVRVRCSRERLWLAMAAAGGILLFLKGCLPHAVAPAIKALKVALVLLWLSSTILSLRFVTLAFGSVPPRESG